MANPEWKIKTLKPQIIQMDSSTALQLMRENQYLSSDASPHIYIQSPLKSNSFQDKHIFNLENNEYNNIIQSISPICMGSTRVAGVAPIHRVRTCFVSHYGSPIAFCSRGGNLTSLKMPCFFVVLLFLNFMSMKFACTFVCVPRVCLVPIQAKRGHQMPWN